jgi:hypothetical protein
MAAGRPGDDRSSPVVLATHTANLTEEEKNWILHADVAEWYRLALYEASPPTQKF